MNQETKGDVPASPNNKNHQRFCVTRWDRTEEKPSHEDRLNYSSWEDLERVIPGFSRPPRPVPVPAGGFR